VSFSTKANSLFDEFWRDRSPALPGRPFVRRLLATAR